MERNCWYINREGEVGLARQGRNPDQLTTNVIVDIGGPGGPLASWERSHIKKATEAEVRFHLQAIFPHRANVNRV